MAADRDILKTVGFDSKLRVYLFLQVAGVACLLGIGLVLLPLTLWLSWWWSGKFFATLHCELTSRRLRYGYGILFQRESTIPLDKIQDMTLLKGPVLSALGLCKLRIETAGGAGGTGDGSAKLIGVMDAKAFQELVLAQRDREMERSAVPPAPPQGDASVLLDIRDSLHRIEKALTRERVG